MADTYMPILMTSGTPCVLTSSFFPEPLRDVSTELVCDAGLRWVHEKAHLLGDVRASGFLLVEALVVVRGDIDFVALAEAVILREQCVVRPPLRSLLNLTVAESSPMTIGSATMIGRRTVCEAKSVGSYVHVEDDCVIGEWTEVPDGVWLRAGCVVPAGLRLAPYVVYEGRPARPVASLDAELHQLFMKDRVYEVFTASLEPASRSEG
ncbi:trimeric LpxA-like protein [Trypanosoma rangeli]|uniref:Dynactin subunit 5 n=1 Tax=Trypanosoma rangeli TaxID=5698 RepID=A0A422NIN4_TRYRA|nr:trimeric LpxA-like protein [Trypanosoma rangeli]RNF05254.1 trimeric LpxA-like protein [Trypanosoma rangeli]|eukprot:RNF05254.1 trimeric LpxA-like protein [Trypanosoma rangeli]